MSGADWDELEAAHAVFLNTSNELEAAHASALVASRPSSSSAGDISRAETDADSNATRSHASSRGAPSESARPVICPGCQRVRNVSTCFLDVSTMAAWSQGVLCANCDNVYRTTRSQTLTVTMLLNSFDDKRELLNFQMDLVASMTLKAEDPQKPVRANHIAARVIVIKTALSMLGLPAEPFVIMFFEDGATAGMNARLLGQRLLTIRTGGEDRLACAIPIDTDAQTANSERPLWR